MAQQRPLVALDGGPKDKHWYWLDDLHVMQEAAGAQSFQAGHPVNAVLHYHPTARRIDNPNPRYGSGEIWSYRPPADVTAPQPQPLPPPATPAPTCRGCGNTLLLHRAGRTHCARCDPSQFTRLTP